jgi:hypothetical protein
LIFVITMAKAKAWNVLAGIFPSISFAARRENLYIFPRLVFARPALAERPEEGFL